MNIRISAILSAGLMLCWTAAAQDNTSAPQQITTTDGRTYQNVSVQRVDPDGLLVSYAPQPSGFGVAKLKFRDLPDSLREQYKYDADRANNFEQQQAQANAQWQSQFANNANANFFQKYRALAELNRALAGDAYVSYTVSMDRAVASQPKDSPAASCPITGITLDSRHSNSDASRITTTSTLISSRVCKAMPL